MSRLVKEPLFHFLIIGLAIYAGYAWLNPGDDSENEQVIRVGEGERAWMRTSFEKRWKRPPTAEELAGLTKEYVRETAFYREALAMGLDQDDTIVRRRLAQKLEFLVQDLIDVKPPTDGELEAYFDEHRRELPVAGPDHLQSCVRRPGQVGQRDGEPRSHRSRGLCEKADDPTDGAKELGDPFMLQLYYPERTEADISKLFGGGFARSVSELSVGAWQGPVLSGYGVHLVYVHDEQETSQSPPSPTFETGSPTTGWRPSARSSTTEYRDRLLEKYTIVIEDEPAAEEQLPAGSLRSEDALA